MNTVAQKSAAGTKKGMVMISSYVQENPIVLKWFCCLLGVLIVVCGVVMFLQAVLSSSYAESDYRAVDGTQAIWIVLFGMVITIADAPSSLDKCCGIQAKLFRYANFIASITGKFFFYTYVGTIIIFRAPSEDNGGDAGLQWGFRIMGTVLILTAWLMVLIHCCNSERGETEKGSG
mmetsp:Transcript_65188/g.121518  ORF Transcript_65188/g.121518 Transcript_65188/m.121518 type:complete len:176 (+) Transcript_65188:71-598(+)